MNRMNFLFIVHNHQPVGNFSRVFDKAFEECYFPFLNEVLKHPSFKFTLHFSGPLWNFMQQKEKECWKIVLKMVNRRQVELMGGGFYEPILSIIPEEDAFGQIEMMNRFLEENFHVRPRGLWLAERVWEPKLSKILNRAGIEYTLLDEEHLHYAGIKNIYTSYITEEEGYPLRIFPGDKKLRYMIPFQEIEQIKLYFEEILNKGGTAILGDDGEKFGLWPGTQKWVYEEGWLKNFLDFLETENIQTFTCSEYMDKYPPGGRVYLPPASYEEMMEWVLEPEDYEIYKKVRETSPPEARRFLRAGFFREYFLKYPECNHIYKRMLLVSRDVNKHKNEDAKKELYKAQCNDSYWHGVFGGLYLPHLREAVYSHLLQAEKHLSARFGWQERDYDLDGKNEVYYQGQMLNLWIKPSFGGAIVELDYLPMTRNLSNVLSRRKESYHTVSEEEKEEGRSIHELAKDIPHEAMDLLQYDWYPRYSLLDHFLHPDTKKENFIKMDYGEQGDFVNQEYQYVLRKNKILLKRKGNVLVGAEYFPLIVTKEIAPKNNGICVMYQIENLSGTEVSLFFGSEWNLYVRPEEMDINADGILLFNKRISFLPSSADEIWHFPLQTLSQSEKGYDIIHQGMCILPVWKLILSPKEKASLQLSWRENK